MADGSSEHYGLPKPEVGKSWGTWGTKILAVIDAIDALLFGKLDRNGGTLTGPLEVAGGDEATPSIAFGSGTGFYSDDVGKISVTCNGAPVASFAPGGYTADLVNVKNQINGYVDDVQHFSVRPFQTNAANGGLDIFTRGGDTISVRFRITSEGRVGIGTIAPQAKVDVEGNVAMKAVDLASGTAIDCRLGGLYYKTITGNTTFTITNVPVGRYTGFVLELTNAGAFTTTFPASVKWPLGVKPPFTVSGVDEISLTTRDDGVTWRAKLINKGSA